MISLFHRLFQKPAAPFAPVAPPKKMRQKSDAQYLREAMRGECYIDYSKDPIARPAFERLEVLGLIRVIQREGGPHVWRTAQDDEQYRAARVWLTQQPSN